MLFSLTSRNRYMPRKPSIMGVYWKEAIAALGQRSLVPLFPPPPTSFHLKIGGRGHKPRNMSSFKKLEKAKIQILPWRVQKGHSPVKILI